MIQLKLDICFKVLAYLLGLWRHTINILYYQNNTDGDKQTVNMHMGSWFRLVSRLVRKQNGGLFFAGWQARARNADNRVHIAVKQLYN